MTSVSRGRAIGQPYGASASDPIFQWDNGQVHDRLLHSSD